MFSVTLNNCLYLFNKPKSLFWMHTQCIFSRPINLNVPVPVFLACHLESDGLFGEERKLSILCRLASMFLFHFGSAAVRQQNKLIWFVWAGVNFCKVFLKLLVMPTSVTRVCFLLMCCWSPAHLYCVLLSNLFCLHWVPDFKSFGVCPETHPK